MEKQTTDDETSPTKAQKPEVGKRINMVLLATARHEAMMKRLHESPMFVDLSKFEDLTKK